MLLLAKRMVHFFQKHSVIKIGECGLMQIIRKYLRWWYMRNYRRAMPAARKCPCRINVCFFLSKMCQPPLMSIITASITVGEDDAHGVWTSGQLVLTCLRRVFTLRGGPWRKKHSPCADMHRSVQTPPCCGQDWWPSTTHAHAYKHTRTHTRAQDLSTCTNTRTCAHALASANDICQ